MTALHKPQPPPNSIVFCIKLAAGLSATKTDDAKVALQEMQDHLLGLGHTLTVREVSHNHYECIIHGWKEGQKLQVMEILGHRNHNHWYITTGDTTCQD